MAGNGWRTGGGRAWAWIGIALLFVGCASGLARLRSATYPPDFEYMTRTEIRTTMGRLALQVDALDQVMRRPGGARPDDQERVAAILEQMLEISEELKPGQRSNHPVVDRNAPRLQKDIARALIGARQPEPDYYWAGRVSGACTYCHAPRSFQRSTRSGAVPRSPRDG